MAVLTDDQVEKWSKDSDYYKVLGVGKGANAAEIRVAYKKLALKWHPDRNPSDREGAQEKFQEVGDAYAVLGDDETRSLYDGWQRGRGQQRQASSERRTDDLQERIRKMQEQQRQEQQRQERERAKRKAWEDAKRKDQERLRQRKERERKRQQGDAGKRQSSNFQTGRNKGYAEEFSSFDQSSRNKKSQYSQDSGRGFPQAQEQRKQEQQRQRQQQWEQAMRYAQERLRLWQERQRAEQARLREMQERIRQQQQDKRRNDYRNSSRGNEGSRGRWADILRSLRNLSRRFHDYSERESGYGNSMGSSRGYSSESGTSDRSAQEGARNDNSNLRSNKSSGIDDVIGSCLRRSVNMTSRFCSDRGYGKFSLSEGVGFVVIARKVGNVNFRAFGRIVGNLFNDRAYGEGAEFFAASFANNCNQAGLFVGRDRRVMGLGDVKVSKLSDYYQCRQGDVERMVNYIGGLGVDRFAANVRRNSRDERPGTSPKGPRAYYSGQAQQRQRDAQFWI